MRRLPRALEGHVVVVGLDCRTSCHGFATGEGCDAAGLRGAAGPLGLPGVDADCDRDDEDLAVFEVVVFVEAIQSVEAVEAVLEGLDRQQAVAVLFLRLFQGQVECSVLAGVTGLAGLA